ncbi:MAG: NUDIX hydrolase, partial [Planctomycetaceae bacterium]|nr:NUDIX hydrolase [Planctomycetaceae bacterium]
IFVEQFRPPVGQNVLEMPAGLAGDIVGEEDEDLERAARRELLEETGYETEQIENLGTYATSAGMSDETVTMFLARDCWQSGPGGGDAGESIQIHKILRSEAYLWLEQQRKSGQLIDARVLTGLWLLDRHDLQEKG